MIFFTGFIDGLKRFNMTIASLVNALLLTVVYIIGVGLTSLVARLVGKHFLDTKKKKSYWIPLNLTNKKIDDYYRQF